MIAAVPVEILTLLLLALSSLQWLSNNAVIILMLLPCGPAWFVLEVFVTGVSLIEKIQTRPLWVDFESCRSRKQHQNPIWTQIRCNCVCSPLQQRQQRPLVMIVLTKWESVGCCHQESCCVRIFAQSKNRPKQWKRNCLEIRGSWWLVWKCVCSSKNQFDHDGCCVTHLVMQQQNCMQTFPLSLFQSHDCHHCHPLVHYCRTLMSMQIVIVT